MTRHRLVKLIVQPVIVADDGENLAELQVQPLTVDPADLDTFAERLRLEIAALDTAPERAPATDR